MRPAPSLLIPSAPRRHARLTATEKLAGLDEFLNGVGLTSEVVAARANTNAQSWRDLGVAASNAKDALGGLLAGVLAPVADSLADVTAGLAQGLNFISAYQERMAEVGANILASSESYDEYLAQVDELNARLPILAEKLDPVSRAAFDAAKGMEANGAAAGDAAGAIVSLAGTQDLLNQALGTAIKRGPEAAEAVEEIGPALLEQAAASEESRAAVDELLQSYVDMGGEGVNLEEGLATLAATQLEAAAAAAEEAAEQQALTDAKADADAQSRALADSLAAQATATDDSTAAGAGGAGGPSPPARQSAHACTSAARRSRNSCRLLTPRARAAAIAASCSSRLSRAPTDGSRCAVTG